MSTAKAKTIAKARPKKTKATAPATPTPPVEYALILRTCSAEMTSHNGFVWPESGPVEAPDWKPTKSCGNGLHGFLWGEGDHGLADWSDTAKWLVAKVDKSTLIDLDGKVKFPRADVVFCGERHLATAYLAANGGAGKKIIGGTITAGDMGTATAGYRGTATAGDRGTATAGDMGTATAGYRGTATAGDMGTATAGDMGTATAGDMGTATAGDMGTATAGDGGVISVQWFDESARKYRRAIGVIGECGLEAGVKYRFEKGQWVAAVD